MALNVDEVVTQLTGERLRGPVLAREDVNSTMDEVRALAVDGAHEGIAVAAESQSGGRGRRGRVWHASPGQSLLFSVLLRPDLPVESLPLLTSVAGVAVATVLRAACSVPARTKWPNDVCCHGGKIAGILVEAVVPHFAVVGIGLNVLGSREHLSAQAGASATSLQAENSSFLAREVLLALLLNELDRQYGLLLQGRSAEVLAAQSAIESLLGETVRAVYDGEAVTGIATGLDETGGLCLRTDTGPRVIRSGEVSQVRRATQGESV